MRAFVTSVGEPTTNLCVWALERNGFKVTLLKDRSSLVTKLAQIYNDATDDFIRVDADTIVNSNCTKNTIRATQEIPYLKNAWWIQFMTFCWFSQDATHGGVQFITQEAIPFLKTAVNQFKNIDRPETQLSRIYQFYNPRRFETNDMIMGLNGYGINDIKSVKLVKAGRGQLDNYDFELAERLNKL